MFVRALLIAALASLIMSARPVFAQDAAEYGNLTSNQGADQAAQGNSDSNSDVQVPDLQADQNPSAQAENSEQQLPEAQPAESDQPALSDQPAGEEAQPADSSEHSQADSADTEAPDLAIAEPACDRSDEL